MENTEAAIALPELAKIKYPTLLDAISPWAAVDHYKVSHRKMYPTGVSKVYSNLTARSAKYFPGSEDYDNKVVVSGLVGFYKWYLVQHWNDNFFSLSTLEVQRRYAERYGNSLGPDAVDDLSHIVELHALGYLPIRIKTIREGSRVNIKVPVMTITNTDERFAWLVNYLETVISSDSWKGMTTATLAYEYRRLGEKYADITGASKDFVKFQFHDFAARGMSGFLDAAAAGFGHLSSFAGTDTVAAIEYAVAYYNAKADKQLVGVSVPATEHSVVCSNILFIEQEVLAEGFTGEEARREAERRLLIRMLTILYPKGILSYVSDSYDFWSVVTDIVPSLKEVIMGRAGKLVVRPDSGDPVRIVAGYAPEECAKNQLGEGYMVLATGETITEAEYKGTIVCLWETFGGTTNEQGYKELDSHIGLIYGDSVTLKRASEIFRRLADKGFASSNVVFGVGSYTYQYNSRDSLGFAIKATYCVVNGRTIEIHKDPKTDAGKKSAKGLLRVDKVGEDYVLRDCVSWEEEAGGELNIVFENGVIVRDTSLVEIREILHNGGF